MRTARVVRHCGLALVACVTTGGLYAVIPTDFAARAWTVASAFASLGFLAVAMSLGPLIVLRGGRPPKHLEWRRDLGIWAAVLGLAHVLVGLRVHFGGVWSTYFVYGAADAGPAGGLRTDAIGMANWAGLLATTILIALLATSNNISIRRMGLDRWKWLQRTAYVYVLAVAAHGVVYQRLTARPLPAVVFVV